MPGLLEARKWDSVRAILITPPLSDCWGKNARPLLRDFAAALGDSGGDELAALEAREDAMSHLRYLDMAVYNNVFSPAGGDAAVSASKDLVRQYVELPAQELAPAGCEDGQDLVFNPWNMLADHKPLGLMQRARYYVYQKHSAERIRLMQCPVVTSAAKGKAAPTSTELV